MIKTSTGKEVFHKKPLGRRWHLISSSARSGAANLVSITSGTERKRGFAGILPSLCGNLNLPVN